MKIREKHNLWIFLALTALLAAFQVNGTEISSTADTTNIKKIITYLSSEELAGRKSGEPGDSLAAVFIREQFVKSGLKPLYQNGFQYFKLVTSVETGQDNHLSFHYKDYTLHTDFLPYSFSANKTVEASVVFAGYGFSISSDSISWNDYMQSGVKGKWVLILKGDPEIDRPDSKFAPFSEERSKVLTAQDNGAAGVFLVAGPKFSEKDELQGVFYDKNSSTYSIPVVQMNRKTADELLSQSGKTIEELENILNTTRAPYTFPVNVQVKARTEVVQKTAVTRNVVALLEGVDPVLKHEYVVIGAHYDHLGKGGPGSGSRAIDTLATHFGADDNASGVALMIELANRLVSQGNNRRSYIFAAFGAEEMGLIGSTMFTSDPPVGIQTVKAMFNFDMVGRLDAASKTLSIGGSQTSIETEDILERLNNGFSLNLSPEGSGPSDHAAFYMQDIPVFFVSTGAHGDYHTPGDTPEKINYGGISAIANYFQNIIGEVGNRSEPLTFRESGSKSRRSRGGRFKVTLGVMPDFAGQEKSGLRIDAVTKGKPASIAGMMKGDIITAINGNPVGNIYDYMNRLNTLEEGQTISIDLLRNGVPVVLIVQL